MTLTHAEWEQDVTWQQIALQERAKLDFAWFCRHILGFGDLNAEHEALCEFLQHHPARIKLILMPRYTFKSSLVTIAHSLWLLLCDPNERILLYSDAATKSEGFLTGIKNHILGLSHTSRFRAICDMPWEVDPKLGVWNQSAITVRTRTVAHAEPSIETAGLESSKVGKHYSRIKFDDLVSDVNVTTKDLMDKVAECYKKALSLLQPSGQVELAGTRWHFGDLYGRLLAEHQGHPEFAVFHRRAYEGERYFFADIGKDSLTKDFLAQKRATQGSRLFSALYQNDPVDEETATFKIKDFAFYDPVVLTKEFISQLHITCTWDPIPPPSQDHGDDAALVVVGTDHEYTLYLLDLIAGRLDTDKQIDAVFHLHAKWRFKVLGLEANAFQKMLASDVELRLKESRTQSRWSPFHIEQFSGATQGNKERRIEGLQPWHERGALKFPGTKLELLSGHYSTLAFQMVQFPHSAHDDLLDALAYHLPLIQQGATRPQITEFPRTSAAWYEREIWRKQQHHAIQRLPRWKRPPAPQCAFS